MIKTVMELFSLPSRRLFRFQVDFRRINFFKKQVIEREEEENFVWFVEKENMIKMFVGGH